MWNVFAFLSRKTIFKVHKKSRPSFVNDWHHWTLVLFHNKCNLRSTFLYVSWINGLFLEVPVWVFVCSFSNILTIEADEIVGNNMLAICSHFIESIYSYILYLSAKMLSRGRPTFYSNLSQHFRINIPQGLRKFYQDSWRDREEMEEWSTAGLYSVCHLREKYFCWFE